MKLLPVFTILAGIWAIVMMASCSSTPPSSRYPTASAGVAHKLEQGTVVEVREVVIDGQATNVGMAVGGVVGGAVGAVAVPTRIEQHESISPTGQRTIHTSSNANESRAATGVGAAVGMVVGRNVEKKLTTRRAQELMIELDSGERMVVVQDNRLVREPFQHQERVQVYTSRLGGTRVFHGDEDPYVDPETNAYLIEEGERGEKLPPVEW